MKLLPGYAVAALALAALAVAEAKTPSHSPPVVFHPPGGLYSNHLAVTLTCGFTAATIHYTINGSEPTQSSPTCESPIPVSHSLCIRARAFAAGQPQGEIVGAAYTIVGSDLLRFNSNLPLLLLNTYGTPIYDGVRRPAYLTIIGTNQGRAAMMGPPDLQERVAIELRGSSSLRFPKKGYGFAVVNETSGADRKAPLLGMPADSDWVLYAPYADKTLMREVLADDLWEDMGHYSVRRRFVELFCDLDGNTLNRWDYAGIYVLLEKIKHGKARVPVSRAPNADPNAPVESTGYLLKKDRIDKNDNPFTTPMGFTLGIEYPKDKDLTPAQLAWVDRWFEEFETALRGANFAHPADGYAKYIDVPSFIDYHWIVEMPKTIDGYTLSVFMYKERGGKLVMSPIWDRNLGFGNANYQEGDNPAGWFWWQPSSGDLWYRRLFEDPEFNQRYIDRWGELRRNLFATSNLFARIEAYTALLAEAQARDFARWPRLGHYVWPNSDEDWPNRTYAGSVQYLKQFIQRRLAWLDRQFLPAPVFNQRGGVVPPTFRLTMDGTSNAIYYTLDLSDPRLPGGQLNPAAREYRGPIPVAGKTRVFARARKGPAWSPPTLAVFVVDRP